MLPALRFSTEAERVTASVTLASADTTKTSAASNPTTSASNPESTAATNSISTTSAASIPTAVLSVTVWTFGGTALFEDWREAIETFMTQHGLPEAQFVVQFFLDDETAEVSEMYFSVLLCRFVPALPLPTLTDRHFLTALHSKACRAEVAEPVSFLPATDGEATDIKAECLLRVEGSAEWISRSLFLPTVAYAASAVRGTLVRGATLLEQLRRAEDFDASVQLTAVILRRSVRSLALYFADPPSAVRFLFRNAFGTWEVATLPATVKVQTKVERETARCSHTLAFYDETLNKSYEVQTSALDHDVALWCEQLLSSPEVYLLPDDFAPVSLAALPSTLQRVLVTESEHAVQEHATEPSRLKFTWRFADDAPHAFPATLPAAPEIFSDEYTAEFS